MATESEIQQVKDRTDLIELIGASVKLKRAGRNFMGLCPFHEEKNPSFFVSPERGNWHCFGCNRHGDAFTFLMERESLTFGEALAVLAERAGVRLTQRVAPEKREEKQRLLALNSLAAEFYHYLLTSHKVGQRAREYLEQRGVTRESILGFKLGYAPNSWRATSKYLLSKGYTAEEISKAGLAVYRPNSSVAQASLPIYDRFRARLMFPVWDNLARIVGFSGRLHKKDSEAAKYINSPETPIFTKGRLFYGLHQAKDEIRSTARALLVEGNLDVISLHQAGYKNTVASLGTALTANQLKLINRFTQEIVLLFDKDEGGEKATLRTLELAFGTDLNLSVVTLTGGTDPDEAIQKAVDVFKHDLANALPALDYLIKVGKEKFDISTTVGQKGFSSFTLPFVTRVANLVVKERYIKKVAGLLEVSEKSVLEEMERIEKQGKGINTWKSGASGVRGKAASQGLRKDTAKTRETRDVLVAEHLLTLVFNAPQVVWAEKDFQEEIYNLPTRYFPNKKLQAIWTSFLEDFIKSYRIDLSDLGQSLDAQLQRKLDLLILHPFVKIPDEADKYLQALKSSTRELKKSYKHCRIKEIAQRIKRLEKKDDQEQIKKYKEQLKRLARELDL